MIDTLQDKVAVVTGGGSGIGRATSVALAEAGTHVVVADIDTARSEAVAAEATAAGARSVGVRLDVSSQADFDAARSLAEREFGRVDIVMNNVGLLAVGLPDHIPIEEWQRIVDTNLLSVVRSNATFLPLLLARRSGHIVNTASTAGLYAYAYERLPYSATKAAVIALSEALALYCRPQGVGVTVLCPGPVSTNIGQHMKRSGPPVTIHGPGPGFEPLTPEVVGAQVRDAIIENRFLCLTHPSQTHDILVRRAEDPEGFLAGQVATVEGEF